MKTKKRKKRQAILDKFFEDVEAVAWRKLREKFPDSVDAGVYHVDDVSICVSFDPSHNISVLPCEVEPLKSREEERRAREFIAAEDRKDRQVYIDFLAGTLRKAT